MNVSQLLADASVRVAAALGLDKSEARIEVRALAVHAWLIDTSWLIAHDEDVLTATKLGAFQPLLSRRLNGEPVAYIVGEREFYGLKFAVTPDVLIPRPETETLVDAALERLPVDRPLRILDLGTGSGIVAISLARHRPQAQVIAVDASRAALDIAQRNAERLGVDNMDCIVGNWYAQLKTEKINMIVANPPYVEADDPHLGRGDLRFEPRSALASGMTGLDDLHIVITGAPKHLAPSGWLLVEHGWNQGAACRALFEANNFSDIQTLRDLAGQDRVTLGRQPG